LVRRGSGFLGFENNLSYEIKIQSLGLDNKMNFIDLCYPNHLNHERTSVPRMQIAHLWA
jgi:hypothetical protein